MKKQGLKGIVMREDVEYKLCPICGFQLKYNEGVITYGYYCNNNHCSIDRIILKR